MSTAVGLSFLSMCDVRSPV